MLGGKAYDRAVRGHLLVESALHNLSLQSVTEAATTAAATSADACQYSSILTKGDVSELSQLYQGVVDGSVRVQDLRTEWDLTRWRQCVGSLTELQVKIVVCAC